jgi:hypothetical protein
MKHLKQIIYVFILSSFLAHSIQAQWVEIFNGENLEGWEQVTGNAKYEVIDKEIVGTAILNSPNSFLKTTSNYSDFILEMEFFMNTDLNSGVQIRSQSIPSYRNGAVHGYQIELDPSPRAFTGGIYDEQRRAWMYPLSLNEPSRAAFKMNEWNHLHIEAIGDQIDTWVNGVHCASLADDLTAEGFIALQVHSISKESGLEGAQVKWRNIRIVTNNLPSHQMEKKEDIYQVSFLINKLSDWEKANGYELLWDGKTSKGWRGARLDGFPEKGWTMKDGVLTVEGKGGAESAGPGDIVTIKKYGDFDLEVEFKISKGANSGIKYFVDPALNKGAGSAIGCEFQILDDKVHPDAKMGVNGNRTLASLYDLIQADNLDTPGRGKQFKGVGTWNKARIVTKDGKTAHWLNGEKTVEYDRFSQIFKALVAYSKYAKWENFGQWPKGSILLQDHGDTVHFRSIKIREL